MTAIGKGFDSDTVVPTCEYCGVATGFVEGEMVICGTGNSLLAIYHPLCWEVLTSPEKEPLT